MARRIYVGGLPQITDEAQIQTLFAQQGQVNDVQIITDRNTGRSKGFAFVEMLDEYDAQKAIKHLNGTEMAGRTLVVSEAKERETGGQSVTPRRY